MFTHRASMCLADDNYSVVVATAQRFSSMRTSREVTATHYIPLNVLRSANADSTTAIAAAVERHRADVVFPTDLVALRACTGAASQLPIPVICSPSNEVVDTCHNKDRFAELLTKIGAPHPHTTAVHSLEQARRLTFDRPMIAKPIDGDGGIGVNRVDNVEEFDRHTRSGLPGTRLPLLVQEFVPGVDIDCSFYAEGGNILAWAVQTRSSANDPLIEFVLDDRVVSVCRLVVAALGYDGLGHADLRIDERDGTVKVIELNPRVWGSVQYAHFVGAAFPGFAVRRALGLDAEPPQPPVGSCRNPPLEALSALKGLLGRQIVAPPGLSEAEQRMFIAKHADPMPHVVRRLRSKIWRAREGARARIGRRGAERPTDAPRS